MIRSNLRPSALKPRRAWKTSSSRHSARLASSWGLCATLRAAVTSAGPDESMEITLFAPPARACREKPPGVAEAVEHVATGGELAGEQAVVALIEVEAGLVAADHVHLHAHAVLDDGQQFRQFAVGQAGDRAEPFELAHIRIGTLIHRAAAGGLDQPGNDGIAPLVGPGAGQLYDHHRTEAVGDDAGQTIGLPVDQAHAILPGQPGMRSTTRHRRRHRTLDEGMVDGLLGVEGPHPRPDLRLRRPRRPRQRLAAGIHHQHRIPRPRPALQPVDRTGEDPGVPTHHGRSLPGLRIRSAMGKKPSDKKWPLPARTLSLKHVVLERQPMP
jgi:hypothetical protein